MVSFMGSSVSLGQRERDDGCRLRRLLSHIVAVGLSFPILLILNQLPPATIALNFGLQVFWVIALLGLFSAASRR
jgi:hypothetical protein